MRRLSGFVIAVLMAAPAAQAQSLGDVARQEEARRKTVQSTGKVYTEDSLRGAGSPAASIPASATAPDKDAKATSPSGTDTKAAQEPQKDEKYWRKRLADERDALSRSQAFAEALQSRINALTADFANQDDPARRNQTGADRQKSLAELDRVKKDITDHTKAIADIQEEARKAGVPAGWVR
jgi:hypothetical protein